MIKPNPTVQLLVTVLLICRGLGRMAESFMLPEALVYSVMKMSSPERYICKYLCRNMTPSSCSCKVWVPCLGKICREGAECRILGRHVKPQTLCCPQFKKGTSTFCKNNFKKKIVTWNKRTKFYRFNEARGGCERMTWYSNSVQTVVIPGYTEQQVCTYCSLYTMCTEPVVTPL